MLTYDIYMEGYIATGERGYAHYVGIGVGETFADAAYDACVKRYGKEETDRFFTKHSDNEATYWGCRLYGSYDEAKTTFG